MKIIWNECEIRRMETERGNSQQGNPEEPGSRERPLSHIWRALGKPALEPQDGAFALRVAKSLRILKRNLLKGRKTLP